MLNFQYYTPTKVHFGKGAENEAAGALAQMGVKKVLIHFGGGSIRRSGLLGRIEAQLTEQGISYVELGGVEPNPKIGLIRKGIELCRRESVDFILAIGGGSVIDSAKGIGMSLANNQDPWDMIMAQTMPQKAFPVGVILTIAAAGSEMSNSHVVTNPEGQLKRSLNHDLLRPAIAFMNPELTYTVSPYQTACGIVDIMMHTLERYCTPQSDCEITDRVAEGILCAVKNAGEIVMQQPDNYEARATLMWASSISHNGLTGCGKVSGFPVHKIEHEVSGMFDQVSHGAGLAVLFPAWAEFVYQKDVRKFAQLATRVWGVDMDFDHPERTALKGIYAMRAYFANLGMPTTLRQLNVPETALREMAEKCTQNGQKPLLSYEPLGTEEIMEIFKIAQ